MNKQDEKVLYNMLKELKETPEFYQPSRFWKIMNGIHLKYLSNNGFTNFKRTVNRKYFDWGILGIVAHQISPVLKQLLKGNLAPLLESEFDNDNLDLGNDIKKFNDLEATIYRVYLASLYEYTSKIDRLNLLGKIEEPLIGNPFIIKYKGKFISQDLCNSIQDFYSMLQTVPLSEKIKIAELGAGYGRVGYVLLKALPKSAYCVIDIPPALFIAQKYLSKIFPKEKIFRFRKFKSFKEIRKEFEESRIQFMMPYQIELLPNKYFDLFINISSLHEMTREHITNYLKQIDRLTTGYFYTKQWRRSRVEDNHFIAENEYPIPESWKVVNKRNRHPIQNWFFDALYRIR